MSIDLRLDVSGSGVNCVEYADTQSIVKDWLEKLRSDDNDHLGADYKGWVKLAEDPDESFIRDIEETANEIKDKCTLFIVVGIGGSFLGAKAVVDALNGSREDYPEIIFAGYNMSAAYLGRLIRRIKNESVCMCVISKSGRTVEPLLAYSVLKDKMFAKYGYQEARKRIYVITDEHKGDLIPDAFENQFKKFVIPDDVGGRYSVLTSVGLLPVAVAGHDIRELLRGAAEMGRSEEWKKSLIDYTVSRVILQNSGRQVEVFEFFESNLTFFGEWLKQLFGESEGKDGKGAFPSCLMFSRDLHSIGQFLQQGSQVFYETMIRIEKSNEDFVIPWYAGYPYAGKTLEQINDCAEEGVILAHKKAGIPVITIQMPELNAFTLGQLIYFFEMSAALSAYALGVNPFDQPGVEAYKSEMMKLVGELK